MDKSIDLGKAFTHVFEDPDWVTKALLGAAITIVPILNFATAGYEVQVVRNASKGEPRPMPTWDDIGGLFTAGLPLALARIAVALPATIVILIAAGSIFMVPFFAAFVVPDLDSAEGERTMVMVMGFWFLLFFGGLVIGSAFSFIVGFLFPAMTANFVRRGTFASCFEVREIFDFVRRNSANYVMVWLAGVLVGLLFAAVYMFIAFIPCMGPLVGFPLSLAALFYYYMVSSHALGQAMALDAVLKTPSVVEGSG